MSTSVTLRAHSASRSVEPDAPARLLGTSPAMTELRKAVSRAAAAPFAVLIDPRARGRVDLGR